MPIDKSGRTHSNILPKKAERALPSPLLAVLYYPCKLVDGLGEYLERASHGLGGREVYPREAKLVYGIVRCARFQKFSVAVRAAAVENILNDGNSGAEARRILINIVRSVEVRYACPFGGVELSDMNAAVIASVQLAVHFVHAVCGEWSARRVRVMRLPLKLGKERLAEHCRAEALEKMIEHVCAALRVALEGEQVFCQQHLVDGGGDLCREYRIIVVRIALRLA